MTKCANVDETEDVDNVRKITNVGQRLKKNIGGVKYFLPIHIGKGVCMLCMI